MNILKDENFKKIIKLNILLLLIFIITFYAIIKIQYAAYSAKTNNAIDKIMVEIQKKYPEVSEEEIMETLNSESNTKNQILNKYGYIDVNVIKQIRNNMNKNIIIDIIIFVIMESSISAFYISYLNNENKEIQKINKYLKELNKKNYSLKIEENGEAELSKLQNELYKTTILLKETAEKSIKEKEQLGNSLADISHQLKTPLTSITIMLDNIMDNPDMDEKTREEFILEINKQVEWINSLVIALLKLAKFDAGAIKFCNKEINIKQLLENVISNLSVLLEIKGITVNINSDENATFIGDYKWQLEAFTNIVKNAVEHSMENSNINITVVNTSLFLKIVIQDMGEGISKEDLKHLFERFYKSKNSLENSVGIGLSLAKAIIEKNNGYIKVESKENVGTKFEIKYIK